jgi:HK97 gp10 family phage protein
MAGADMPRSVVNPSTVYVDEVPVTKKLRQASANTRKAAQKVTRKYGKEVKQKAKRFVPAPGRAKYAKGDLQGSIMLKMSPDGLTAGISAVKDYAVYVEYAKGLGTGGHKMKGTPFMGPALKQVRPKYIRAMEKTIAKALFDLRIASL